MELNKENEAVIDGLLAHQNKPFDPADKNRVADLEAKFKGSETAAAPAPTENDQVAIDQTMKKLDVEVPTEVGTVSVVEKPAEEIKKKPGLLTKFTSFFGKETDPVENALSGGAIHLLPEMYKEGKITVNDFNKIPKGLRTHPAVQQLFVEDMSTMLDRSWPKSFDLVEGFLQANKTRFEQLKKLGLTEAYSYEGGLKEKANQSLLRGLNSNTFSPSELKRYLEGSVIEGLTPDYITIKNQQDVFEGIFENIRKSVEEKPHQSEILIAEILRQYVKLDLLKASDLIQRPEFAQYASDIS
jgi:hypothetical protein